MMRRPGETIVIDGAGEHGPVSVGAGCQKGGSGDEVHRSH